MSISVSHFLHIFFSMNLLKASIAAIILIHVQVCALIVIKKEVVGVVFIPYVKTHGEKHWYSLNEIKTMLRVISTRFKMVLTEGNHAIETSSYVTNQTYYYGSFVSARIPEAAAILNFDRKNKSLTVTIGITVGDNYDAAALEINVAVDAFKIANSIYPGTATGFLIRTRTLENALLPGASAFHWIDYIRRKVQNQVVNIGVHGLCQEFMRNGTNDTSLQHNLQSETNVFSKSDFICCDGSPEINISVKGGKYFSSEFGNQLLDYRYTFQTKHPALTVMGMTWWPSSGNECFENLKDFTDLWVGMNEFASRHTFPIWLKSAFDNPHYSNPHLGWWNLSSNKFARDERAYNEKVSAFQNVFRDECEPKIAVSEENKNFSTSDVSSTLSPQTANPSTILFDMNTNIFKWVFIGVGTVGFFVCLTLAIFCYFKMRLRTLECILNSEDIYEFKNGTRRDSEGIGEDDLHSLVCASALEMPYDDSLEIPKRMININWDSMLGSGQFGCVYKGTITGHIQKDVAIKTIRRDSPSCALKGLLSEIKIMSYIGHHENIVKLVGACTLDMQKGVVYLAIELCGAGSLKKHLLGLTVAEKEKCLKNFLHWSYEIAAGMEHLEQKRVIHADLAARNVLLTSKGTAKISDFGLSRRINNYSNYVKTQQEPLPWRNMAIESLKRLEFSHFSDVWSYGVTLWEIFSFGEEPFPCMTWSHEFVQALDNGLRLSKPNLATTETYQIMTSCWKLHPTTRPTFKNLKMLTKTIVNDAVYTAISMQESSG